MPTTVVKTDETSIKIDKPSHIMIQPIVNGVLGDTIYDLGDALKDSTSIEQADSTSTKIERETNDTPIKIITTLGDKTFKCTVNDLQESILVNFLGCTKSTGGKAFFAPSVYTELYCQVMVVCDYGTKHFAYIIPNLMLDSKSITSSMSTTMGGVQISGTAMNAEVTVDGTTITCSSYFMPDYTIPVTAQ